MDYQQYFHKQLQIFNYHLHSDYGLLLKAATCIAFGAIFGWLMGVITLIIYKLAERFAMPAKHNFNYMDDEFDLDLDTDTVRGGGGHGAKRAEEALHAA
ncbi:CG13984 [Drosophila busckii]|uniref:CG13984 n=1 Tax=Drosophila busckii TaxID=30019 RepID=A0A0M4EE89_DROBS|nr:uncharacterized protein LOC108601018 [Drosophila busckii]ALC38380.1 CG13984 [Drosophila busckii]